MSISSPHLPTQMTDQNWALARKRSNLEKRARIIKQIRAFFNQRGYLEVETPHRIPANAPEAHINPVASGNWALHTSPEIAMKRMLAAGYDNIYQLCRVWREGERGQQHLPEFTMLEWYRVGIDYNDLMGECEDLLQAIVPQGTITTKGKSIDLTPPWERLTVTEAFDRYASKSLAQSIAADLFEELLSEEVEPRLGQRSPTFLIEYPASMAALARKKPGQPEVAERFELYIDGVELANAFSELTITEEQRQRFKQEEASRRSHKKPLWPMPEKFLAELDNMPDAAGIALGIDRLVTLLTGADSVDDVIAFTPEEL